MNHRYILDGHTPVRVDDFKTWARAFDEADRRVAKSGDSNAFKKGAGKVWVSTVFLGIDHQWGTGPPLLFETMIFGGEHDEWQDRCSTWEEAEAMHQRACELAGVPA
jgi:hypothetical protein